MTLLRNCAIIAGMKNEIVVQYNANLDQTIVSGLAEEIWLNGRVPRARAIIIAKVRVAMESSVKWRELMGVSRDCN